MLIDLIGFFVVFLVLTSNLFVKRGWFKRKFVKRRPMFDHKGINIKGIAYFFIDFDLNTIMLIKSSGSIGNTLKTEHEHDIFKQMSIFLLTFFKNIEISLNII